MLACPRCSVRGCIIYFSATVYESGVDRWIWKISCHPEYKWFAGPGDNLIARIARAARAARSQLPSWAPPSGRSQQSCDQLPQIFGLVQTREIGQSKTRTAKAHISGPKINSLDGLLCLIILSIINPVIWEIHTKAPVKGMAARQTGILHSLNACGDFLGVCTRRPTPLKVEFWQVGPHQVSQNLCDVAADSS